MISQRKLITRLNQQQIKKNQRILWSDSEILHLIHQGVLLNNLHMYIHYLKFEIIQSSVDSYCQLPQLNQDFTHAAFIFPQRQSPSEFQPNVNKKLVSFLEDDLNQQLSNSKNRSPIILILTQRFFAVDQIVKTNHKLSICVIPLNNTKHLWGGVLTFNNTKTQNQKEQNSQALRRGNQSYKKLFQKNRISQIKNPNKSSYNPKNFRRQKMVSNFIAQQTSNVKKTQKQDMNQLKFSKNTIKINPLNIISKNNILHIQISLIDNPQIQNYEQKFISFQNIIFYGSWRQPIYGKKYESSSEESDKQDQNDQEYENEKKYKASIIRLSNDVFNMYSMPFRQFDSFLDSMLNPAEELPNLKFKTNQKFFSALKRLTLSSQKKQSQEIKRHQKLKSLSKIEINSLKSQSRQNHKNLIFQSPSVFSNKNNHNRQLSLDQYEKTRKKAQQCQAKTNFEVQIERVSWSESQQENIFKINKNQEKIHTSIFFQRFQNQKINQCVDKINSQNSQLNFNQKQRITNLKSERLSLEKELDLSQSQNETNSQNAKQQNNQKAKKQHQKPLLSNNNNKRQSLLQSHKSDYAYFSVINKCSFKPTYVPISVKKLQPFLDEEDINAILQKTILIEPNYNNNSRQLDLDIINQKIRIFYLKQNYPIEVIQIFQELISIKQKQKLKQFLFNIIQHSLEQCNFNIMKLLIRLLQELKLVVIMQILIFDLIKRMAQNNQKIFTLIKKHSIEKKIQQKQKILYQFHNINQNQQFFIHFWMNCYHIQTEQFFQKIKERNQCFNLKANISNVFNDFFLLHAKTISKKYSLEFNSKIKKACIKKNQIQYLFITIQHCLHSYQDIPYEFLTNHVQISDRKSQSFYLDTISELLLIAIQLKHCKNIIELVLDLNTQIQNSSTNKTNVLAIRKQLKLQHFQNRVSIIPRNVFYVKIIQKKQTQKNLINLIQNRKETLKSQRKIFQFSKQNYKEYKVFYNIYSKNICKDIQQISIISQKIKIKMIQTEFLYPFSSKHENISFIITLIKRKSQKYMSLNFVIQSEHPKNYFKEPSFDFRIFKSYHTIVKICINQKYTFLGKMMLTFQVDTPTQHFIELQQDQLRQIQLEFEHIKRVQVCILMKKKSIYDCALMFLNIRLPNYIKEIEKNQKKSLTQKSMRKTIGRRMTQNLNRRQSVLAIQNEMFLTEQQIEQLQNTQGNYLKKFDYTIYSLPEQVLYQILSTDRNYIQKQQKLFKFVVNYYFHNKEQPYLSQNKIRSLLMAIRYSFVPIRTLLKYYLDSELGNDSLYQQILTAVLSQKIKKSNNQAQIGPYLIDRPRITTQKLPKNRQQSQQQMKLILEYMRKKQLQQASKISQIYCKKQKQLQI